MASAAASTSNSANSSGWSKAKKLPATGFAPNIVTLLPAQPIEKAYADEGMWLEIPALGVKQSIVGVPGPDWDVTWLGSQIGYLQGTAFPTWNGNSVADRVMSPMPMASPVRLPAWAAWRGAARSSSMPGDRRTSTKCAR